jgi:hypothetical protein
MVPTDGIEEMLMPDELPKRKIRDRNDSGFCAQGKGVGKRIFRA